MLRWIPGMGDNEWTVDLDAFFASYANFLSWEGTSGDSPAHAGGGLLFGKRPRIFHAIFTKRIDDPTIGYLRASLSADVELVGTAIIDGRAVDGISPQKGGIQVKADSEILMKRDKEAFLTANPALRDVQIPSLPLIFTKVTLECVLNGGKKDSEELESSLVRFDASLDNLAFTTEDKKTLILRSSPKTQKSPFDAKQQRGPAHLTAFLSLCPAENDEESIVPVIRVCKSTSSASHTRCLLECAVEVAEETESAPSLHSRLRDAVHRRLLTTAAILREAVAEKRPLPTVTSLLFIPPGWSRPLHLQSPPHKSAADALEWRRVQHRLFNLPSSFPCLRSGQSLLATANRSLLRDLHLSITNYKPMGEVALVRSGYDYFHYLQDKFDDCGWGCAYRSLQTIASFFIINGFVEGTVPTHKEIQEILVRIGDKPAKFVGSKQWIGSTELGFVLESMFNISSKFITTNSGSEVGERVRELLIHFKRTGTPVMIGGGQLAHTILGVDADLETGSCRFLVLDPHYTGRDDVNSALAGGGLQWKPASFWQKQSFYNLILPQTPNNVI